MGRKVLATYHNYPTASSAVHKLVESGFSKDSIHIISQQIPKTGGKKRLNEEVAPAGSRVGAWVGAGIGAAIGLMTALLVSLGIISLMLLNFLAALGPLVLVLSSGLLGALAGGFAGSLMGSLIGLGITEEEVEIYSAGVRKENVLVMVDCDEYSADQVMGFLHQFDPMEMREQPA